MQRKITKGRPWRLGELGRADDDTCVELGPVAAAWGLGSSLPGTGQRARELGLAAFSLPPTFWVTLGESVLPGQSLPSKT